MMNHRTKLDGDDGDQGTYADADHPAVSLARRSEGFLPLGDAALAVVLRLRTRLPRVLVVTAPAREEDNRGCL